MKRTEMLTVLLIAVMVLSCARASIPFDESAWREKVAGQKIEDLYKPHVEDGKYFNPWMPMDNGRFLQFLRWRFSRKGRYTAEENE